MKSLYVPFFLSAGLFINILAESKLNVMFITLDDMNRDSVGIYGSKVKGTTPNIDKLARQGLRLNMAMYP